MYVLICQTSLPDIGKLLFLNNLKLKTFPPALRACWIKLNSTFAKKLQPTGITPDQYSVLRWIHELDQKVICQKELTKLLFTDPNNIASLVKRMEKNGHAVASDGRKKNIVATELGRKKWLLSRQIALELEDRLMSELSENEKCFLLSSLKQISTYLNG